MSKEKIGADRENVIFHIRQVLAGERKFENAAQGVSRMILEKKVEKRVRGGKPVYDFEFFREGPKHIIGLYDKINDFVHFVKSATEDSSAAEMAFVLVGEPGNGKTFFVDYICRKYREFLAQRKNRKYTFKFVDLDKALGYDQKIAEMHSLTFEDPLVLAMNLSEDQNDSQKFLAKA